MMLATIRKMTLLVAATLLLVWKMNGATAWLSSSSPLLTAGSLARRSYSTTTHQSLSALFQSPLDDYDEEEPTSIRRRASLEGVSLAPTGFWVMLRIAPDGYLPWQVTDDPQDAVAATSAEALTMIQLLSGVDMAGAILPPDVLAKLVIYHCEAVVQRYRNMTASPMFFAKQVSVAQEILSFVQESLPNATVAYSEVHPWVQSRVKLPEATLDEVLVSTGSGAGKKAPFSLTCTLRDFGSLTFTPSLDSLQAVLYQFSPNTSLAFTTLALALRYQAPITVETGATESSSLTLDALKQQFPMYATVSTLQQSSHRVQQNIVRGFEIHKLSGALRIAMEKGDHAAAAKIRQALDEYDSMDDLPTAALQEDGLQQQPIEEETAIIGGEGSGFFPQQNMTMSVLQ